MLETTADYGELSNANLEETRMELQKSLRQLSNKRRLEGTLADTLESYGIQLEKSRKIMAESWAMQVERCRKDSPGNGSFCFHPGHDDARRFLDDHNGDQNTLKLINAQVYSMTRDEYQAERDAKYEAMATIDRELLLREAKVKHQQADAAYDAGIQRIPKYTLATDQEITELPF